MLIVGTHHAREINVPVIGLGAAERMTAGYGVHDSAAHGRGQRPRDLDCAGLESRRLQLRFHHRQPVAKEPPRSAGGVGVDQNRNYAQGWGDVLRRAAPVRRQIPIKDRRRVRAGDPDDDDLVAGANGSPRSSTITRAAARCCCVPAVSLTPSRAGCSRRPSTLSQASGYDGLTRAPSAEGEH